MRLIVWFHWTDHLMHFKSSLTVSTAEDSPSCRLSEDSTASRLSEARNENCGVPDKSLLDVLMRVYFKGKGREGNLMCDETWVGLYFLFFVLAG